MSRSPSRAAVPVLYIAGAPRSGSTLLERIIGTREGVAPVGELRYVWERSFGENQLCGCGVPFHVCEFWRAVSRAAFAREPRAVDHLRARRLRARAERRRNVPSLLLGRMVGADWQPELASTLVRLYDAILRTSGGRVVLDSSKDPRYGLLLCRTSGLQVHVLHVVRDARAVAFSWRRRRSRPEIHWREEQMAVKAVLPSAARWVTHNAFAETLSSAAASYSRIRYEDLVADPGRAVARALRPHGLDNAGEERIDGASIHLTPTHTVAGNPMRFANGALAVRPDEEWRSELRRSQQLAVQAVAWPMLSRYGYRSAS
jgi:hypothetical protein